MNFKVQYLLVSILAIYFCGCSNGSSSGSSSQGSTITELDLTGTWRFAGVECYDSSMNVTAAGIPSSDSSVSTTTISGNVSATETLGIGSCKIVTNRSIVANLTEGNSSGGAGTGSFGTGSITTQSSKSCSTSITFQMISGSINPSSLSETFTNGDSLSQQSFQFLINPPYFAITSLIQVIGRPSDICFLIYESL